MGRHFFLSWGSIGGLVGFVALGCGGKEDTDPSAPGEKTPENTCPTVEASAQRPAGGVQQISAAADHVCALLTGGAVRCWGEARYGVLGYGNTEKIGDDETPASAGDVDVGGVVQQISTGNLNTCALLVDGTVRCWGAVHFSILDPDATDIVGDDETPASRPALDFGQPATQISVGAKHACVVLQDQSVRCWGDNAGGELGVASSVSSLDATKSRPVELAGPVRALSVGGSVTCAVLEDGSVSCWGNSGSGALGYGNSEVVGDDETPLSVGPVSLGASAYATAVGRYDQCAILECGDLRCWGFNRFGTAGLNFEGAVGDDELPDAVPLVEAGGPVKRVAVGTEIADEHSCAVLFDNTVRCWGSQWSSSDDKRPIANDAIDFGGPVLDVVVGDGHACVLMENGSVRCWGTGQEGQLGTGTAPLALSPSQASVVAVVDP